MKFRIVGCSDDIVKETTPANNKQQISTYYIGIYMLVWNTNIYGSSKNSKTNHLKRKEGVLFVSCINLTNIYV